MVELCKDRVTALVDRDAVEMTRSHCARVKLSGVPDRKASCMELALVSGTCVCGGDPGEPSLLSAAMRLICML